MFHAGEMLLRNLDRPRFYLACPCRRNAKLNAGIRKTANAIDFRMAASANELTPLLLQGELDILAVPANLGSVLYNKTQGGVKMLAVSTLGVLYMVEKGGETVTDIKSLAGKTIYATGKGATPEYALTYLLHFGATGIFVSMACAEATGTLCLLYLYRQKKWLGSL